MNKEISDFLAEWRTDPNKIKPVFEKYLQFMDSQPDVEVEMKSRPGISYSLRGKNPKDSGRPLFAMVDVVDDEPENRWLSVCFYADMVTDPEEQGDYAPGGLLGEDAICFNLEDDNNDAANYVLSRLKEAADNASR